jgi:outer membrane protein assembly factor BamA
LSVQVPIGLGNTPRLPIGGDQLLLLQAEFRINIVKLFDNWLGVSAFGDAGDVAAPSTGNAELEKVLGGSALDPAGVCLDGGPVKLSTSIQGNHLHYAVGAGLRYHTVLGTIRADVGVRLNRLAYCEPDRTPNPDPTQRVAFHISIGESF